MGADERAEWSAAELAEYRQFVRTHHPDVGGDPEGFVVGLRRFHQRHDNAAIVFVARKRGLPRLVSAFAARRRRRRRPRVV
ncbi:hypothetical protein [Amycolatopsis thermoflava]|uniref:hypothetical protein n=1 Tax=Amycolatopsis thermoflava TaxID=84480 RepID=UPI0004168F5B|nr:hypothetical protein [Amycolatopsis thermoflava]